MFLASVETTSLPFNTCAGQLKSSPISVSNIDWSSQNDFYILDIYEAGGLLNFFNLSKIWREISAVPAAISNILISGFWLIRSTKIFFQYLCRPKLIRSFIRSYLLDTALNKVPTRLLCSSRDTSSKPKSRLLSDILVPLDIRLT